MSDKETIKKLREELKKHREHLNGLDITERKKADEELKKSEEKFRAFFENEPGYCYMISTDGKILDINNSALNTLGYRKYEIVGKPFLTTIYALSSREKAKELFLKWLKTGQLKNEELNIITKHREERIILLSAVAIRDKEGNLLHSISIQRDITELKKAEEELMIKNRELNTFVYKASHDIRGPFSSISGITNLAKMNVKDPVSLEYFDIIEKSTKRLDKMLADLLQLSTSMQREVEIKQVNIRKLVNEVVDSLKHSSKAENVDFKLKFGQKKKIGSDWQLLSSILQNLIENAIKYKGDIKPFVAVKVIDVNKGVGIDVSDNGEGIPENMHENVFNMFFRGSERSSGTGLGLYIVKTNIEKLGGTIKMKSQVGKGTKFSIYLPG
ncbi:MAG: PAS domain-containing sensor histidine kinase [Bacteroidota bacterium]